MNIQNINEIGKRITELREEMSKGITTERRAQIKDELDKLGNDLLKESVRG